MNIDAFRKTSSDDVMKLLMPRLATMTRHLHALLALLSIAAAIVFAGPVQARDETQPVAAAIADAIESCVDVSTIHFAAEDRHVLLEAADAESVRAAIVRRYPQVEQDGLAPDRVVLWKHPTYGWVYVSLLINPAKPGEVCFTGTFGADKFEVSPGLTEKYFGANAATH